MRIPPFILLCFLTLPLRAQLPSETIPKNLGVNIHFIHASDAEYEKIKSAGFQFVREDFFWDLLEPQKGIYDFHAHDQFVSELTKHHLRAIFIIDYNNINYDDDLSPHTDESRKALAKMVATAVQRYKGHGIIWEMWNEPNLDQFWHPKPNPDDYSKLAIEVGKAVKSVAPNETFAGPACSTIEPVFLERCFKNGCLDYFDAVTVHPYRQDDPETVAADYEKLRQLIDKYKPANKTIPILSGEWGYSCNEGAMTEDEQAAVLARELLTNLSSRIPLSIWYDWHDDGPDPKEPEHHFGTVHYTAGDEFNFSPKPSYFAAKTLSEQLQGYTFSHRLKLEQNEDWLLVFSKGEKKKYVAWTRAKPHEIKLPINGFHVVDHVGKKVDDVKDTLMISKSPLYLEPQ